MVFAADPVMANQALSFCRYLLAGNQIAAMFPGMTAEDLRNDVLAKIGKRMCAGPGRFWCLFETAARFRRVDLFRRLQTRQKYLDLAAGHAEPENDSTPVDAYQTWASQVYADHRASEERVEEAARMMETMEVSDGMRPVLAAIVHEARTGVRISDKVLSSEIGIKQNTICRMRERLRVQAATHIGLSREGFVA